MLTEPGRKKIWSIGGGKGGVGKSILTLGLGISLARLGKKVILIDCDLGGANLHTLMGVRYPRVTVEHFLLRKVSRLEDTIIPTQHEGIGLICGADDLLGSANPTYAQKTRLLNQLELLPAHFVLLDLGAGTSFNLLDLFNYSPGKIALFTPQATSLQNAYGFIKSALYRKLSRDFSKDEELMKLLFAEGDYLEGATPAMSEALAWLKASAPEQYAKLARALSDFQVYLVVNMVKSRADLKSPEIIQAVCDNFLMVKTDVLGHLEYDLAVEDAVNKMLPFPLKSKRSRAAAALHEIAMRILKISRLSQSSKATEEEDIGPVLAEEAPWGTKQLVSLTAE